MSRKKNDVAKERGRWSAKSKRDAVLRLLRGDELDALSRELKVTAAKLSEWRDAFLESGMAGLKAREADARDDEVARLKSVLGEMTMRTYYETQNKPIFVIREVLENHTTEQEATQAP